MDYDQIKSDFKQLVDAKKQIAFVEEYRNQATDSESVGLLVAQHFDWDGKPIIDAFLNALEDANFHDLRAKIEKLVN
jgi:hypothetical protein